MSTDTQTSEYVFTVKKGDLELEVRSNDAQFMHGQVETWRNALVQVGNLPQSPQQN